MNLLTYSNGSYELEGFGASSFGVRGNAIQLVAVNAGMHVNVGQIWDSASAEFDPLGEFLHVNGTFHLDVGINDAKYRFALIMSSIAYANGDYGGLSTTQGATSDFADTLNFLGVTLA